MRGSVVAPTTLSHRVVFKRCAQLADVDDESRIVERSSELAARALQLSRASSEGSQNDEDGHDE
jgi:hypothetical protein